MPPQMPWNQSSSPAPSPGSPPGSPPGSSPSGSYDPSGSSSPAATRAAVFMWVLGAIQTVLFGFCSTGYGILAVMPLEQLKQLPNMNPATAAQLEEFYPWAGAAALALFLLGFCPGVAYLILGFFVKKQRPGPMTASLILVLVQTLVLGVLGVLSIAGAVMQGDPMALTICLIFFGTPLMLQGFTIHALFGARSDRATNAYNPWQ